MGTDFSDKALAIFPDTSPVSSRFILALWVGLLYQDTVPS